jgi:hypothetical protein
LFAVCIAYGQLKTANEQMAQSDEQRKWQNYNELNVRYAALYQALPKDILNGKKIKSKDVVIRQKMG